jgi:nuclear transport factor 2 (NTF2) superfamily protein
MSRPPLPPFTRETAAQKARMAEDAWNSRDPVRVSLAYTEDSRWRNRSEFFRAARRSSNSSPANGRRSTTIA